MLQRNKNKSGKWWWAVKICLASLAFLFIWLKVFRNENAGGNLEGIETALQLPGAALLFAIVFMLMIANWTIEAMKWKYMVEKIEAISLFRSLEAVFSGLTISVFTPNRIGEYAGRVFHLPYGKRLQATIITVIENYSQLLVTILTGCIACIIYMNDFMEISSFAQGIIILCLLLLAIFCLALYFNLGVFESFFERFRLSEYWKKVIHVFALYSRRELFVVFLLSVARYIIFTLQFYILLVVYGNVFPVPDALLMIVMTFFIMSVVPTFAIAEVGVRGAVSAYFFGKLTIDVLPVVNAAFTLWIINLVLPALLGAIFIFHFRLGKEGR